MANADLSDPALKDALKDISNSKSSTNWIMYGYEKQTNRLKVLGKGTGGLAEFKEELSDGKVQFGLVRFTVQNVNKFAYVSWCGEGVTGQVKGKFGNHAKDVERFFKGAYHTSIDARSEEDLQEKTILQRLTKNIGANYDAGQKTQGESVGVKSVREGIEAVQRPLPAPTTKVDEGKIDKESSNQFWEEQRKRDEEAKKNALQNRGAKPKQNITQQREKFWQEQQSSEQEAKKKAETAAVKPAAGNASNIKSKFEQQQAAPPPAAPKPSGKKWSPPVAEPTPPPKVAPPPAAKPPPASKPAPPPPAAVASKPPPPAAAPPPPLPTKEPALPSKAPPAIPPAGPPKKAPPPPPSAPPPTQKAVPPPPEPEPEPEPEPAWEPEQHYDQQQYEQQYDHQQYEQHYDQQPSDQQQYDQQQYDQQQYDQQQQYGEEQQYGEQPQEPQYGEEQPQEPQYGEEQPQGEAQPLMARALYNYDAEAEGDLNFREGDYIVILDQSDPSGWWQGDLNGAVGYFPSNFVELI